MKFHYKCCLHLGRQPLPTTHTTQGTEGYTHLKVLKAMHTKSGEARGSRGRALNLDKNFNAKL